MPHTCAYHVLNSTPAINGVYQKQVDLRANMYMDMNPYTFLVGTCVSSVVHFLIFVFASEMACLTGTEDGNWHSLCIGTASS